MTNVAQVQAGGHLGAWLTAAMATVSAGPGLTQSAAPPPPGVITAPSGFDVTLHEVLYEEHPYSGETMIVIRLVAPAIASPVHAANLQSDMEWACTTWGLPASDALSSGADRIIVELMESLVPRGETSLDTRRFFESYSLQDGLCIWELF